MSRRVNFSERAWGDYLYWQQQDRKTLKRSNQLILDTQRYGYGGIGKPEPLAENMTGYWSKRFDDINRFVFRLSDNAIEVYQCRGHYDD